MFLDVLLQQTKWLPSWLYNQLKRHCLMHHLILTHTLQQKCSWYIAGMQIIPKNINL